VDNSSKCVASISKMRGIYQQNAWHLSAKCVASISKIVKII